MPPQMRQVESSHIVAIGHDAETAELHVKWDNGRTSIYSNVPPEKAAAGMRSWSVGEWLHQEVKKNPAHPHRYAK